MKAHANSFRKGTNLPYIVHPLEAAAVAAGITDDCEIIAAAVLHDVIEDTPATAEDIEKLFGARVCELVCGDSENKREELPPEQTWKIRKQETLNDMVYSSYDKQIVILSDKLANLRSIYRDYRVIGDELWNRFNVKDKKLQGWYYCGVAERICDKLKATSAFEEYSALLGAVFG